MNRIFNQPINAGSEYGNYLGFTSDKFDGYLWDKNDGSIMISLVASIEPGLGNFSELVKSLKQKGFIVKVPTPIGNMKQIMKHLNFKQTFLFDHDLKDTVEIWVK